MTTRLRLFGPPAVEHGGATFALPFERRSQLLVFAALKRGWVTRAELAALLWPGQQPRLAYANLRKTLFRMEALPHAGALLQGQAQALRVDAPSDVAQFEDALREGRLDDALRLRRGELLAGFEDDANEAWSGWLHYERNRLRVAWRSAALERLAQGLAAAQAVALASELIEADPLDEAALREQMDAFARAGQAARARQAYRDFAARLQAELGLQPGAELAALQERLGVAAVRPAAPASAQPAAAPPADDGFVGRAAERQRVAELLARDDCRLLCLGGPGGIGKTRLARRMLRELEPGFADGAVFVPLEDVEDGLGLAGRLALELAAPPSGSGGPVEQVIAHLRDRALLLVLDNFEQLVDEAALLQRLLQACPRLKLLVTSRVRLPLESAWLLPLDGLPFPDPDDADRLEAFDATRLFIRAAQRVEPALVPAAEAAAIADICRQVDGLPLALELAAAWTRVLSCDAIAAELRQGSELLRAADPGRSARHASIELVFEQSWQRLSEIERRVLARLTVLRGGFTADAARAVAGAPLPVLGALADKSLLRKDGARMHLHPLVQQFAALRLQASDGGEAREDAERAHAVHFHGLMRQLRHGAENGDRQALQQLDAEFENCRAAWRWVAAQGPVEALSHSVHALGHFCDHHSRHEEGLALLREALAAAPVRDEPRVAALLLGKQAHMEYRCDRYADALATATRGLQLERRAPDADARAQCLTVLATCHLRLQNLDDARRHFEQSLKLVPQTSDRRHAAKTLSGMALLEKVSGNYGAALRLSLEALGQQRSVGDVAGEALSLNNLAALHLEQQQFEAARDQLGSALALCDRHGLLNTRTHVLCNLTVVSDRLGEHEAAEAYGRRALADAQGVGNRFALSFLRLQLVGFALRRGELGTARSELRAALELAIALGRPALLVECLTRFADLLAAQGEVAGARSILAFAAAHPRTAAPERDELARSLARLPAQGADLAWPGLSIEELAHRIVVEADIAHAPLIAALHGRA